MRIRNKNLLTILCTVLVPVAAAMCFSLPAAAATCSPLPASEGTATATFSVTTTGTYRVWAHVYSPSSGGSAVDFAIDNDCSLAVAGSALPAGAFSWLSNDAGTTAPTTVNLKSGTHTITVAGEDPGVGIDEILLASNTSCTPASTGNNCAATVRTLSAETSDRAKPVKKKLSVLKLAAYALLATVATTCLSLALIYYILRARNQSGQRPLFGNVTETSPEGPENAVHVFTMPEAQKEGVHLRRRNILVLAIGIGIICGLITSVALAAVNHNIIITFSGAKTSGQAEFVTNEQALTGHMLQFGSGSTAATAKGAQSLTVATKPSTSSPQKSKASTSSTSSDKSSSSTSTSGSSSKSGAGSGSTGISGSNCTDPVWSGGGAEDTDSISDTWWVNNDAWSGSAGPQSIHVCNQSSWYATSTQTNNGGQVETYPDTEYDIGGRSTPSTKTISQYSAIISTFSEAYPSTGSWDAAYDLWTDNWTNETMVWNQWTGTEDYWGNCAEPGADQNDCVGSGGASSDSRAATIDGVAYHFLALGSDCDAANEANCEYIFFRDSQVTSGSVDILAVWQWEVANGYAKASDVPTQMEYGVEICSTSGTETFPMTGLTFTVD